MSQTYDLHCHSFCSDGILSPEQLVSRAKEKEVSVLAVTDHDTVTGIRRARAQAAIEEIELISGIEFSSVWQGRNIHILGLNVDTESAALQKSVGEQEQRRRDRGEVIAKKLEAIGIVGALDGAKAHAGSDMVGRPHFARWLVEQGVTRTIDQAFKRYLGAGKPGDVKQMWPDIADVVDIINASGGVAVIAHPLKYKMTRTKLCSMAADFVDCGGQGIEVVSGRQNVHESADLAKIGVKYGLYGSMGSDFHAPSGPWAELGCCPPMPVSIEPVWSLWQ